MSFRSNREILQEKANSENATDLDILKAALYESQEQYNTLARAVLNRLEAVEQSVRQSNDLAYINIDSAVKESVNGITGQIQATTKKAVADIEKYENRLKEAMDKKQESDTRDIIIFLGGSLVVCFLGTIFQKLSRVSITTMDSWKLSITAFISYCKDKKSPWQRIRFWFRSTRGLFVLFAIVCDSKQIKYFCGFT